MGINVYVSLNANIYKQIVLFDPSRIIIVCAAYHKQCRLVI